MTPGPVVEIGCRSRQRLDSRRHEDRKGIASLGRANLHAGMTESRRGEQGLQFILAEPEPLIAEALTDPVLRMRSQVEDQHAPAWLEHAYGFGHCSFRIAGVVECL